MLVVLNMIMKHISGMIIPTYPNWSAYIFLEQVVEPLSLAAFTQVAALAMKRLILAGVRALGDGRSWKDRFQTKDFYEGFPDM